MDLLNENEVVDAVVIHLAAAGWVTEQQLHGHQRGVEIVASSLGGQRLEIEAKGATSSRSGSAKFGQPMGSSEVRINVAEAFYTAAATATRGEPGVSSAMAFLDDDRHRRYVEPLRNAAALLGIGVFWVRADRMVTLEAAWTLSPGLSGPALAKEQT